MEFSRCQDDDTFGPAVHGCRDDFDFTIKFEEVLFSLILTLVFISIALARIVSLVRQPRIVGGAFLLGTKLVTHLKLTLIVSD